MSAAFEPDAAQTGYDNVVHGGVLSALLDELIGWAVALRHDRMACTAELTLRFVKPVLLGARYLARARVEAGRGSCWEASGELADENGVIYAKGRGKYFLFSATRTAEVAAKMTYQSGDLPVFRRRTEN